MLLSKQNYDDFQQYNIHKTIKQEQFQIKQMKQEVMKSSLEEQRQIQEEMKRRNQELQQKEDNYEIQRIQTLNKELADQQKQKKLQTKESLSKKYTEIIDQRNSILNQKRNEDLNIENQIIDSAQKALQEERQNQLQKKLLQRQIYDEQMKLVEEKKQRERLNRDQERVLFQEYAIKDQQRIIQQEEDYKKYYQRLAERNEHLQDIYRKNVDDPKSSLDYIINKQVKEKMEREQEEINTKRQYDKNVKDQYLNTLSQQLKEKEQRRKDYDILATQNKQEIRRAAESFNDEQQQEKKKKREFQSQYYDQLANLSTQGNGQIQQDKQIENLGLSQSQVYNPLTNPNPNQIQNPYILRQLGINKSNHIQSPHQSQSKLAQLGQSSLFK
ncbi:unnamed protein product [Paramecium sonneborni]|uniref:Uncharacterized protein n=1 Tax=Paramecium sonneborni TaxID=65129 RepID=A0A8S1LHJ4_9CILI|nr:unnamed protein product [Paramecium sonneborni]